MTQVEQFLSDVADYAETRLQEDAALRHNVDTLLAADQQPRVVRQLNCLKNASLAIGLTATSSITE
jgi:hypothetical protein